MEAEEVRRGPAVEEGGEQEVAGGGGGEERQREGRGAVFFQQPDGGWRDLQVARGRGHVAVVPGPGFGQAEEGAEFVRPGDGVRRVVEGRERPG